MGYTDFEKQLYEMIHEQKGIYYPVKAGLSERLFTKEVAIEKLHPNPDDEFCMEEVGPSMRIIGEYVNKFNEASRRGGPPLKEPIMVEKTRPDGYLILNGHHRWAAALRIGLKKIPVEIINLPQETDVKKILEKSDHDKRVTFDLDEVIFCAPDADYREKSPGFAHNIRYKEAIRTGSPALFWFFKQQGYDIWLYSSNYYSVDDIKEFLKSYSATVDGVISAVGKGGKKRAGMTKHIEEMMKEKYDMTLHVDNNAVIMIETGKKDFQEIPLSGDPVRWSGEVSDIVKGFSSKE